MRDAGAADAIGTMLLVAVTVVGAAGLGVAVRGEMRPADTVRASIAVAIGPGPDGLWGTGDESLRLTHRGGDALPQNATTVLLETPAGASRLAGGALGGAFADGRFQIGERWSTTATMPLGGAVSARVAVATGSSSHLVGGLTAHAGGSP